MAGSSEFTGVDFYDMDALLSEEERAVRDTVRSWVDDQLMPVIGECYLEGRFPKQLIPGMAELGLFGANLPEDAIYPLNLGDAAGNPLTGAGKYTLSFTKETIPPADAFWSVTLYDDQGFQVANSLNRFALSSWMPIAPNADGSLTLLIQHDSPGSDQEANWLPAPAGSFNLTMRLYSPQTAALDGSWTPPAVQKAT